jgi:hypothetical protein
MHSSPNAAHIPAVYGSALHEIDVGVVGPDHEIHDLPQQARVVALTRDCLLEHALHVIQVQYAGATSLET